MEPCRRRFVAADPDVIDYYNLPDVIYMKALTLYAKKRSSRSSLEKKGFLHVCIGIALLVMYLGSEGSVFAEYRSVTMVIPFLIVSGCVHLYYGTRVDTGSSTRIQGELIPNVYIDQIVKKYSAKVYHGTVRSIPLGGIATHSDWFRGLEPIDEG